MLFNRTSKDHELNTMKSICVAFRLAISLRGLFGFDVILSLHFIVFIKELAIINFLGLLVNPKAASPTFIKVPGQVVDEERTSIILFDMIVDTCQSSGIHIVAPKTPASLPIPSSTMETHCYWCLKLMFRCFVRKTSPRFGDTVVTFSVLGTLRTKSTVKDGEGIARIKMKNNLHLQKKFYRYEDAVLKKFEEKVLKGGLRKRRKRRNL
ncbi:unnamed protein product [Xylocopa violacea]|uniref:Uncharacterized protein n=1 Tax=Xylocopa violacea TaxID=135666 RepID=A0ABP1NNE1_XYLVO